MEDEKLQKIERTQNAMDNNGRDIAIDGLLQANALDYKLPPNLSVVVRRNLVKSASDTKSYTAADTLSFIVNSGDQYVDPSNSYFIFQLGCDVTANSASFSSTATAAARFGLGSAMNVILEVSCTSASGTEVIREKKINAYRIVDDRYGCSGEWLEKYGSIYGYKKTDTWDVAPTAFSPTQTTIAISTAGVVTGVGTALSTELSVGDILISPTFGYRYRLTAITSATAAQVEALGTLTAVVAAAGWTALRARDDGNAKWIGQNICYNGTGVGFNDASTAPRFCIPLSRMSGIFNTNKLIPAGLIGGMRVEITLETANKALVWSSLATANTPPTYTITNPRLVFDTYQLSDSVLKRLNAISANSGLEVVYYAVDNTPGSLSSETSVNVDSKRAVSRAMTTFLKVRATSDTTAENDSMKSDSTAFTSFQMTLAGLNFPNHTVTNQQEMFQIAQYTWDKLKNCDNPNDVSLSSYQNDGDNIVSATLERSNVLALSGLPISSARILQCTAVLASSVTGLTDLYMTYVKVAKVYLNKIIVRE